VFASCSESCNREEHEIFFWPELAFYSGNELGARHKTDLKVNDETFLGIAGLNIVFNNPDSVTEVASALFVINLNSFHRLLRMLTAGKYHLKY
jgi:hypothetical protein